MQTQPSLWISVVLLGGCAIDPVTSDNVAADQSGFDIDTTPDSIGFSQTGSPDQIDLSSKNPFFHNFGTNGRTCGTCHVESNGWTITPVFAQTLPSNSPLFLFDGSDCLAPGMSNPNPTAYSTQMLSKGLVRIDIGIPGTADYTLVSYTDPVGCPNAPNASDVRMYRRPLPSSNSAFLSTVMWDGRENVDKPNNTVALVEGDLEHQANDATLGHAQAAQPLPPATQQAIMAFETDTFNGQSIIGKSSYSLQLTSLRANGGAAYLYNATLPSFFIGINDVLGCVVPNSCDPSYPVGTFTSTIFTVFQAWETNPPPSPSDLAASIGRGERIFNTRTFPIDNVAGINGPDDTLGLPSPLTGTCGTCHDSPNLGNHSTSLPINIGVTVANPVGGLDVSTLPTYTFQEISTGATVTLTDPGRGLITGKFVDLGKTKGPNLRALASRAPYFHNGSARDLNAVVTFYNARFHIGLSSQDVTDLVNFLDAL